MRACMLAYTFYENDNRVRRYAEALAKRGDHVDAVVLQQQGQEATETIEGVHVHRIQKRVIDEKGPLSYLRKLLLFLFRSAWFLTWRHLKARYDIIHVHSVPDFQVFATLIPRLMGARVILDVHDIVPEFYASKFKITERSPSFRMLLLAEKISSAYAHHVIISNHLWYDRLTRRSVRPEKCTTIINYPDLSIFYRRPRTTPQDGHFVMCYPGTLIWHQGVDLAIAAVAQLRDQAPGLRFLIIGDGPDRGRLTEMIKANRLEDRVTMCGMYRIEKVAEIMANVDLGVVPKRSDPFGDEAFSTKIPEFMAMGVPVVAACTRIDRFYFKQDMLQFFEPETVEDLAGKILALMSDPARRVALRDRAMDFINENNWDVRKHEYLNLVDGLVHGSARTDSKPKPCTVDRVQ